MREINLLSLYYNYIIYRIKRPKWQREGTKLRSVCQNAKFQGVGSKKNLILVCFGGDKTYIWEYVLYLSTVTLLAYYILANKIWRKVCRGHCTHWSVSERFGHYSIVVFCTLYRNKKKQNSKCGKSLSSPKCRIEIVYFAQKSRTRSAISLKTLLYLAIPTYSIPLLTCPITLFICQRNLRRLCGGFTSLEA